MHFARATAGIAAATTLAVAAPATIRAVEATVPENVALSINASQFADASTLQTSRISYTNNSAYIGQIKYQTYSEPLIVTNPAAADASISAPGLTFQSIHSTPTGWQSVYVFANATQPVGLSSPHSSPPANSVSTGFEFATNSAGEQELQLNGENKFHACQPAGVAELNSWQIYWLGAEIPYNFICTPNAIQILPTDAAARS